jgi:hypothetical protein
MSRKQFIMLTTLMVVASIAGGALTSLILREDNTAKDTLEIRNLTLVDDHGDPKIVMSANSLQATLRMYGTHGNPRLFMHADSIGTTMVMYGEGRDHRLSLGTYTYGTGMRIQTVKGKTLIGIPWAAPR